MHVTKQKCVPLCSLFLFFIRSVVHFIGHCFNAVCYSHSYSDRLRDLNAARYPMEVSTQSSSS